MIGLTDLPVELVRLIASHTSYASVLSLSCVNRKLWSICQDWTIFKHMLQHKNPAAWRFIRKSRGAEALTWKNFAQADFYTANPDQGDFEYLTWAPQMLALDHPLVSTKDISALLRSISQEPLLSARVYAFCFAAKALSFELPPDGSTDTFYSSIGCAYSVISCVTDWSCRALDSSVSKLSAMGPLWNEAKLLDDNEWPVDRDHIHAIVLKALGLLIIELKSSAMKRSAIQFNGHDRLQNNDLEIPTATDIPFADFMHLPTPFSFNVVARFTGCHLPKMATKFFFENGEWGGMEFGSRISPRQAPRVIALQSFSLLVTSIDEVCSEIIDLESSHEHLGLLQMSVNKCSGIALIAIQSDSNAPAMHWQGVLTPFGLVGTTTNSSGNWFWLWKKSWTGILRSKYNWEKAWGVNLQMTQQALTRL